MDLLFYFLRLLLRVDGDDTVSGLRRRFFDLEVDSVRSFRFGERVGVSVRSDALVPSSSTKVSSGLSIRVSIFVLAPASFQIRSRNSSSGGIPSLCSFFSASTSTITLINRLFSAR